MDLPIAAIKYFVMGKNSWHTAETWPPPNTSFQRLYLHSRGQANTAAGDGSLTGSAPVSEPADSYIYDPLNPVPTVGGRVVPQSGLVPGPIDQVHIEKRMDVLCYTTAELQEDLEITGPIMLHLFASSSAVDTDFTGKLVDVYPDGRAYNVANGIIRARYRKSIFEPELMKPSEIYEFTVDLGPTSNLFKKGHRIRVDVSSSNFPAYDRNMNTGNPPGDDTGGIIAHQTIYHESEYASYIDLPVVAVSKI